MANYRALITSINTASRSARNLGVVLDDQLDFKEQVAAKSRSCRFLLYNIRRIRPYLTTYSTQLLVQAMEISRLDYCNSLLASLPELSSRYSSYRILQPVSSSIFQNVPTSPPCYGHSTGYQLLLGSDSKFWLWPMLQPTRQPLTTYRTSFRPTHQLDHSTLLPQAVSPILQAMQLSLARPDCGASPP